MNQLQGQAEQDQASLGQSELNLEFTVVRAQQDGWVTRRNVDTAQLRDVRNPDHVARDAGTSG